MVRHRGYVLAGGLAAAGLLSTWPFAGLSQEQSSGRPSLEFVLSERVQWEDGDDVDDKDKGWTVTTGLGLSLDTATAVSKLSFDAYGGLENNLNNGDFDWSDPRLSLTYGRESRSSAFDLDLGYRRRDVNDSDEDDNLEDDVLRFGKGTREDITANVGLIFGREAPLGGSIDLGYGTTTYSDASDPDLVDGETVDVAGRLSFVIDPRITAFIRTAYSDTDEDKGGRDVRHENVSIGTSLAVTPTFTADIFIGHTRFTETESGIKNTREGTSLELSFTEKRLNGNWTGSFISDINDSGDRRTTARINRSLNLPRGTINAGFGFSQSEGEDLRPLYSLAYLHETPRSQLNVSLDQRFTTTDSGDDALNSRLGISFSRELTALSSLQAGMLLRSTDYLTGSDDPDRRVDLSLTYRHSLAEDWDLVGGYTHRVDTENDTTNQSDKIFLSIEKSFWRRF